MPEPIKPLVPLDSPLLRAGPYTENDLRQGRYAIADAGTLFGYVFQVRRYYLSNPRNGTVHATACGLPCCDALAPAIAFIESELRDHRADVLRYCRDEYGRRSWITAGIAHEHRPPKRSNRQ